MLDSVFYILNSKKIMMQQRSDLNLRVSALTECLEKGETTGSVIKEFMKRWGVSKRTVETYMAMAKTELAEREKAKTGMLEELRRDAIAKAQASIMSDLELEAQLCAIAKGELELEKKVIQNNVEKTIRSKPTHFDIILAIDKPWKKRGSYPEEKKQVESQSLNITYNLSNPEDIKYIEGV
jgi:hypothetical protein